MISTPYNGISTNTDSFSKKNTISSINIQSSETKTRQVIPHLFNDISFKYLGVHTSPNGCQKKQLDVTSKTAQDCAKILVSKLFTQFHSRLYSNSHLNMKLYFLLTTSSLPDAQYIYIYIYIYIKPYLPSTIHYGF